MKWLVPVCALAFSACGGSDLCSNFQSTATYVTTNLAACLPAGLVYNAATCSSGESACNSNDQDAINNGLSCINNLTSETCSTATYAVCTANFSTISIACNAALLPTPGSTAGATGTTSGTTTSGSSTTGASGTTSGATTSGSSTTGASSTSSGATGATTASGTTTGTHGATASGGTTSGAHGATTSGTNGSLGGLPCVTTTVDPCQDGGFECSNQSGTAGTCVLPYELEQCGNAGCATDGGYALACVPLAFEEADGGVNNQQLCLEPCVSSADCADVYNTCQLQTAQGGFCFFDFCPTAAAPYATCDAGGANDGQCLPYSNGTPTPLILCTQTGPVAPWAVCDETRATQCTADNTCIGFQGETSSHCLPICDTGATTGPQSCPAPGLCDALSSTGTLGACLTSCSGGAPCPTNASCDATIMYCE